MIHSRQFSYRSILFIGLILPVMGFFILSPKGPLLWFIIPGALVVLLVGLYAPRIPNLFSNPLQSRKLVWVLPILSWVIFLLYFLFVILYGTSIPPEIYIHWFTNLPNPISSPTDTVLWASFWLFCLLGLLIPREDWSLTKTIAGILYSWFGILVLLWGFAPAFFLYIFIGGLHLIKKLGRPLGIAKIIWLVCLFCFVLLIIFLPMPDPGTHDSWDQKIIRFIQIRYQNNTLILDLPGRGTRQIGNDFGPARGLSDRSVFELQSRLTGRYYLENQRSSQLGVQGWIYKPNIPSNPAGLPSHNSPEAELQYLETWWALPPYLLTIQNNTLFAPSVAEISEPLTYSETVNFYSGNPHWLNFEKQDPFLPEEIQNLVQQALPLDLNGQITLLRSHLFTNYYYSLTTRAPEAHQHPLERFFEDKVGYCLHFATFGTLYFQALGYQAYFSEGYTGNKITSTIQVRGIDSHAWVSIDLPDYGSIIVDPTPPIRLFPDSYGSYTLDRATEEYLQRLYQINPQSSVGQVISEQGYNSGTLLRRVAYPILFPVGILFIFVILRHYSPKKRWVRSVPTQDSSPISYEHMNTLIGNTAVEDVYLPSLLRWYGYTNEPSYSILGKQMIVVKKLMSQGRSYE